MPKTTKPLSDTEIKIEWQLQTMTRPSEAAGTRWEEIDIEQALWSIPAERMKSKRPHKIPSDRNPKKHTNVQTANMALKRMGFGGLLVAHGLRSIASTTLNEQGFDPDVIEAALAHGDKNDVRSAYNRAEYLERRKKMMQWWSAHIQAAAEGSFSLSATRELRAVN